MEFDFASPAVESTQFDFPSLLRCHLYDTVFAPAPGSPLKLAVSLEELFFVPDIETPIDAFAFATVADIAETSSTVYILDAVLTTTRTCFPTSSPPSVYSAAVAFDISTHDEPESRCHLYLYVYVAPEGNPEAEAVNLLPYTAEPEIPTFGARFLTGFLAVST